jgi:hypothetical protein
VVYTFVDPESLASIRQRGLLSGELIAKSPSLLALARPNAKDRATWLKTYHALHEDPKSNVIFKGPSVFFSKPDFSSMSPGHPIRKRHLLPVRVRLGELLRDHPEIQVLGVELKPYRKDMTDEEFARREHILTPTEIAGFIRQSPASLWRHHNRRDTTHYASDVPHGIVLTPRIAPRYLIFPAEHGHESELP